MKKSIEITPEQFLKAVHEVNNSESIRRLAGQAPIVTLICTLFGMQLTKILFNNEEDKDNE